MAIVTTWKNMNTQSSQIAGKNLEDLTIQELEAVAKEAGREAIENAKKRGSRITELINGQLIWVYPDGRTEPVKS
jgi:hypothetical protein